jgi:hypothetical protein
MEMEMTDALERIWVPVDPEHDHYGEAATGPVDGGTEYIRKDLNDAAIAELVGGLRGLLKAYEALCGMTGHDFHKQEPTHAASARALIAKYGDKT